MPAVALPVDQHICFRYKIQGSDCLVGFLPVLPLPLVVAELPAPAVVV
jgi:hypothetical protein